MSGCANSCEIKKLCVHGETPLFYGGRCEKYEAGIRCKANEDLPDLFAEREKLLERFSQGHLSAIHQREDGDTAALFSTSCCHFL